MELAYAKEDAQFRDEVRSFLDEKLTPDLRRRGKLMTSVCAEHETTMEWHGTLFKKGLGRTCLPVEHGGCDRSNVQHCIFASEFAAAGAPPFSPMGVGMWHIPFSAEN